MAYWKQKTPNRISKKEKRMLSKMKMGRKQKFAKKLK